MGVILILGRRRAILRRGEWRCADIGLERRLNLWTEEFLRSAEGPGLAEADQEMAVAREMAARTGGRVIHAAQSSPERTARDFFSKRQLPLAFPEPE